VPWECDYASVDRTSLWSCGTWFRLAAISIGSRFPPRDLQFALVTVTDERIETDIAGGNFGHKKKVVTHEHEWQALWTGGEAEADDLANTLKEVLEPETFTFTNIVHKLSEAAAIHKKKLTKRHVSLQLGMSFEDFRTNGEREVSPDVRNQLWYEIRRLDFGCEMLVSGFGNGAPLLFKIDNEGTVTRVEHFAAIGTGTKVAEVVLYQRKQQATTELNQTLYNVYEAFKLSSQIAPAVAGGPNIWISEHEIFNPAYIIKLRTLAPRLSTWCLLVRPSLIKDE
jgi:Proteasome subunit